MIGNINFPDYFSEFSGFQISVRDISFPQIEVGDYDINLNTDVSSVGVRNTNLIG